MTNTEHCDNDDACGNTSRYISPYVCKALAMRMNPVGFRVGQDESCEGCGAAVTFVVWPDSASPSPPLVDPSGACHFPEAIDQNN